ncbi:HNH endonuclease signature motif containing protein [Pseudomonas sp.]|uniref:HNH endonuclease signature motif containing protein n=1 Tax=Pseudomonas sp. TaxID=306 RepID=UPI00261682E5|nr:HNH endonuclease signature motif containing protein [Pseudomonas sp.]
MKESALGAASHGEGAPVPSQIADLLQGREFRNFRAFREAFWKAVANDPELSKQFIRQNLSAMANGKSPFVNVVERAGTAMKFELHHKIYISQGGGVYDVDNMTITTPRHHKKIHRAGQLVYEK